MGFVPFPAKDWSFKIKNNEEFVELLGVVSFSLDSELETVDVTDFSSNGWKKEAVTVRGKSITLDFNYLGDFEKSSTTVGYSILSEFGNSFYQNKGEYCTIQMFDPVKRGFEFDVIVNPKKEVSGGVKDIATSSFELKCVGKPRVLPYIQVSSISAIDTKTLDIATGEVLEIDVAFTPLNASNKVLRWHSDNTKVATVVDGVVTPCGVGMATITVTSGNNSATHSVAITVVNGDCEV